VQQGWDVRYVIVTSGQKGAQDVREDPDQLGRLRETESREAARICGVTEVSFLGWMDTEVLFGDGRALRKDLSRQLRIHRPHRLVTMDPGLLPTDSFVNHPDHRAVATAVLDVIVTGGSTAAVFPELMLEEELPPWRELEEIWIMGPAGGSTVVDITETVDRKLAALRAHHSQVGGWDVSAFLQNRLAERGYANGYAYAESFRVISVATPQVSASDKPDEQERPSASPSGMTERDAVGR
jgi:LmbE family N-acetylglucosaminyl deacetylase